MVLHALTLFDIFLQFCKLLGQIRAFISFYQRAPWMQCEREREQKSEYWVCVLVGEREVLISSEHNQKREKIEAVK